MTTSLFSPLSLRDLTIPNRIWLAPMCQYMVEAEDGVPTDWHLVHLGARAQGGFGLLLTEATAVVPEGRISPQDTGLWNDDQRDAWARITGFVHEQGAAIGVQLAHAGRKASTFPSLPGQPHGSVPLEEGGWETLAPTARVDGDYAMPHELDESGIAAVVTAFADATRRADAAGFDVVEIHAAHGYLLHQFLSPVSNHRTDAYGGDLENRARLLLEVTRAVREVWPESKPLFVRLSATDWLEGGWDVDSTCTVSAWLKEAGADLIDVSSGGIANAQITVAPGYQVPFAEAVKHRAGVATGAVGLITEPRQAEDVLASDSADAVLLGRVALREPSWPQRAAHELGVDAALAPYPPAYHRGVWPR